MLTRLVPISPWLTRTPKDTRSSFGGQIPIVPHTHIPHAHQMHKQTEETDVGGPQPRNRHLNGWFRLISFFSPPRRGRMSSPFWRTSQGKPYLNQSFRLESLRLPEKRFFVSWKEFPVKATTKKENAKSFCHEHPVGVWHIRISRMTTSSASSGPTGCLALAHLVRIHGP